MLINLMLSHGWLHTDQSDINVYLKMMFKKCSIVHYKIQWKKKSKLN